ncbi:16S rRNA (cytosine(1402)-N(4))-methyltransferase RsmH [Mycobacterium sp. Y57]|uniref:16S rRNA (cytosine(1402)-N(4))-methyltransferase RsmH n=1 Tax=Mycolicibacterium xanthum TaxID=2796469 RepID=UPI001C860447|nr:16S rRNA (cytosine(1402)-N(4))-methyltransferase RsmH [Mycolicibacterium xanthum]MBX7431670.1 16S rRNA (cytosine(1402)-N(4))-methyltransferase RsmH [Mycolicibacterium xanthum]
MKHSATSFDLVTGPQARAVWPLPEPTLTYFPDVRFAISDRDHIAGAVPTSQGAAMVDDEPHVPVLLDRCVDLLAPALSRVDPDGTGATLVDATLGAGGHAERFLTRFPGLRLIGLDRDPDALQIAGERLAPFGDRVTLVRTRYDRIGDAIPATGVDAVLFDLGVSSMQLDRRERGFSYSADAPLDMRMDPDSELTAAAILNGYDEKELARVLREYGEERFAGRIAAHIVRRRASVPFTTTSELVELLYQAIPAPARRTGGHPAKRTFQALRIAVNAELESLRRAIPAALQALRPDGRIAVMSYQSLEDRIVKAEFAAATASRTPPGLPVELPGHGPEFVALTRGAERADAEEIDRNPRSAPVRLRALEKVGGA